MADALHDFLEFKANTRRQFLKRTGLAGAAAVGAGLLGNGVTPAQAAESLKFGSPGNKFSVRDDDILNFALNLEYLEANYYQYAVAGHGLAAQDISGVVGSSKKAATGTPGTVTGGTKVSFTSTAIADYAAEIANDEYLHVQFLRAALGSKAVAQPDIDIGPAFSAAAVAAGIISSGQTFDPYSSDAFFLLGAFVFEDVGVTAYHGAAPYVKNPAYLSAAAGILGTEAYHAGTVRTNLFALGQTDSTVIDAANAISALRATASGASDDQGITNSDGSANIVPTDASGLTFARTFTQVLNVVYLGGTDKGGFFPNGLNGRITSNSTTAS